jgi:hypothetical protein
MGRLVLRLVPWSVVDDQQDKHADNRDRNRELERRASVSIQTIFHQMLRHLKIRGRFL